MFFGCALVPSHSILVIAPCLVPGDFLPSGLSHCRVYIARVLEHLGLYYQTLIDAYKSIKYCGRVTLRRAKRCNEGC